MSVYEREIDIESERAEVVNDFESGREEQGDLPGSSIGIRSAPAAQPGMVCSSLKPKENLKKIYQNKSVYVPASSTNWIRCFTSTGEPFWAS